MILYFTCVCGKRWKGSSKKCKSGAFLGHVATQQTYRRYCGSYRTILWRDDHPEEKKRTSYRSFRHFRKLYEQSILNQIISLDTWILRERKGFCRLHSLIEANLDKHSLSFGSYFPLENWVTLALLWMVCNGNAN